MIIINNTTANSISNLSGNRKSNSVLTSVFAILANEVLPVTYFPTFGVTQSPA